MTRRIALAVSLVLIFAAVPVRASDKDTPESVMDAAKQAQALAKDEAAALSDVNAFLSKLATDKGYASKLLEAIQKKDSATILSLAKQTATKSQVSVVAIDPDFRLKLNVKVGGSTYDVCISNNGTCDGHNVTLG